MRFYPEILPRLPKDVALVCWDYDADADPGVGHFANRPVRDRLGEYNAIGLDYFICPAEFITAHNVESFSAYAARHRGLGVIFAAVGEIGHLHAAEPAMDGLRRKIVGGGKNREAGGNIPRRHRGLFRHA